MAGEYKLNLGNKVVAHITAADGAENILSEATKKFLEFLRRALSVDSELSKVLHGSATLKFTCLVYRLNGKPRMLVACLVCNSEGCEVEEFLDLDLEVA